VSGVVQLSPIVCYILSVIRSRGSSVSIVSDYGLDDRGSIPDKGRRFFFQPLRPDRLWTMGTGGPVPEGKVRPGRDADHSNPSSTEDKNEQKLYVLSHHSPPWRVAGSL
jgi:hypothetical protein